MKPLLLHGSALSSSRKKLTEIKNKFDSTEVVVFEKGSELSEILTNLQSVAMFDGERLVIVENPPEGFVLNSQLLVSQSETNVNSQLTLVLWFDTEIKKIPNGFEVLFFPEAKEISVFPFLDLLAAGKKEAFLELKKLKNGGLPAGRQGFDIQYIITMIFYLLRNLVADPPGAKDFVKRKNARMRINFPREKIVDLYKFVIETDFKIKSGLLEPDQAEFLIVNKFIG